VERIRNRFPPSSITRPVEERRRDFAPRRSLAITVEIYGATAFQSKPDEWRTCLTWAHI